MALLDHHKNRRLVSASLVVLGGALGCLCGVTPVDLAAQNVSTQQIQSMVRGASPQQIMERLRQSGLTRAEVQDQLLRGGYDPSMADPYFDMMEGVGGAPTEGADELLTALGDLGILLRDVEVSPEDALSFGLSDADSLALLTALLDSLEVESLPVFGKSFFERTSSFEFRQLENGAVGADYRLGPGDEIILSITGDVELNYSLDVNRSGMILISDVGQVSVSGLTITDLENRLYERLGSVYSGVSRDGDATTHFDVSLGALRTIAVYVSGEVEHPNRYPLSSVGTLLEALYAAGGPTEIGSLRRVRIERGQTNLGEFDLYSYFVDGSSSGDIRLENGDLVFVPPAESQVTLTGAVRRQAIFELLPGETAVDLLKFAGGLSPEANSQIATVERFLPADRREEGFDRVVIDLELDEISSGTSSFEMLPGDNVMVHSAVDLVRNWAEVLGAVWSPGTYQLSPGQTVADLFQKAGGIRPDVFELVVHISRVDQETGRRSLIRTSVSSAAGVTLAEFDRVTLFAQDDLLVPDTVSIFGLVQEPGDYPLDYDMTAEDLILRAGGFQRGAIPWVVEIVEPIFGLPGVLSQSRSVFLSRDLPYPDSSLTWPEASSLPTTDVDDVPLGANFEVYVRRLPNYQEVRHVTINGEINRPGTYVLQTPDEKLTSIIERAGGITNLAYLEGGRLTRQGIPVGTDFVSALAGNIEEDLVLANEDEILVPVYDPTVLVQGAVAYESRMRYRVGMNLAETIANAGGYVYDADKGRVSVEYLNGKRSTVRRILWLFKSTPDIEPGSRVLVPLRSLAPGSGFDWNTALSATLATMSAFATVYIALVR